jgi:glucosamine--fructose-6-phosphate aminotransferase (isomerizing)
LQNIKSSGINVFYVKELCMCGIVGYIGQKKALNILLNGLSALEYRGYDSAGVSIKEANSIATVKTKGKIIDLASLIIEKKLNLDGEIGIGHTRWATHGIPNTINAHPHSTDTVSIVHNGIIENYRDIEKFLSQNGIIKTTDTDTETVVLLIDMFIKKGLSEKDAFEKAISMLKGSFAIAAIFKGNDVIMLAKNESPLVIGIGADSTYIASDISALIDYTNEFIFLEDGDWAFITFDGAKIYDKHKKETKRQIKKIEWSKESAQKGGYKHFMIKEIAEEADSVRNTIQSRIDEEGNIYLEEEIKLDKIFLENIDRITIVACGTSYYAGLSAKPILEKYIQVPVNVEIASEFRYSNPIFSKNNLFIVISQSGETADTKESLNFAKKLGLKTLSIVNVKESAIARIADSCIYTLAGPEISVASTKAFVSQLSVLYMIAFYLGKLKGVDTKELSKKLLDIPNLMHDTFEKTNLSIKSMAKKYHQYRNFLYLGRGLMFPIALEGALKLKEISYIHAEGYPAGEMKHGPIALIDENTPTVLVSPDTEPFYSKTISNSEEIKARSGKIIMISDNNSKTADDFIEIDSVDYDFSPFVYVIPLQLFAYYIALYLGHDIDQPRNLAKSVTVE